MGLEKFPMYFGDTRGTCTSMGFVHDHERPEKALSSPLWLTGDLCKEKVKAKAKAEM